MADNFTDSASQGADRTTVAYLGPEGTFSHAAARRVPNAYPVPVQSLPEVFAAVSTARTDLGVIAVENTVEGSVMAAIDGLLAANDIVATAEIVLPIKLNAFTERPYQADDPALTQAVAHPHGLAQVRRYIARHGWQEVAAGSNAAAVKDVRYNQVAFGAPICGALYGRYVLAEGVEDFPGALTRFLVIARRTVAIEQLQALHKVGAQALSTDPNLDAATKGSELPPTSAATGLDSPTHLWRTLLAITPRDTGPGVLARVTKQFGRRGINMSSLISRPLKALSGQYVFVLTMDAAPWEPYSRALLADLLAAGDAVKTLGVWAADAENDDVGGVITEALPPGSATGDADAEALGRALLW